MKKTMSIGTEQFEVMKAITGTPQTINYFSYRSIFSAYARPSQTKIYIWEYWCKKLYEAGAYNVGVASKNCNIFTISFSIDIDGTKYLGYITPAHNRLTPVIIEESEV